MNWKKK